MADDVKKESNEPRPKGEATPKKAAAAAPKGAAPKKAPKAKPAPTRQGAGAKAPAGRPGAPAKRDANPYDVVFHPMVTEKTMFNMDKNNALEFIVAPRASKPEIKAAIEQLFTVKVQKVTTRVTREGKRAVVRFAEGYSAEDIGTRIGVF